MNCFYAPNEPAIGICKSCGKGLSREFATDLDDGLACKDRCEDRVLRINSMIDANSKVMTVSNTQLRRNAIFTAISGVFFIALGWFMGLPDHNPLGILFSLMGLVFIIRGIFGYTSNSRYPTPKEAEQGAAANP